MLYIGRREWNHIHCHSKKFSKGTENQTSAIVEFHQAQPEAPVCYCAKKTNNLGEQIERQADQENERVKARKKKKRKKERKEKEIKKKKKGKKRN